MSEEGVFRRVERLPHSWEDVSYHGSPLYECRYCGVMQYKVRDDPDLAYCPRAAECLAREAAAAERAERSEYERMRAERERWEYLRKKYEGE